MTLKTFSTHRTVRFADCDPAGIVFFPQYLVMLNTLVEEWFDDGLGINYAGLIGERRIGLPTVRLEVDFTAVSRHGDRLRQQVAVTRLGRTSLGLRVDFLGTAKNADGGEDEANVTGSDRPEELRMRATQVLVCTSLLTHRPQPFPADVLAALAAYVPAAAVASADRAGLRP